MVAANSYGPLWSVRITAEKQVQNRFFRHYRARLLLGLLLFVVLVIIDQLHGCN